MLEAYSKNYKIHYFSKLLQVIANDCTFYSRTLIRAVSRCLQEIKPDLVLPKSLPENMNMAQRFTVASTLAEACIGIGYRGDIGYQTFLYPNVVHIRRLFMFLIEQFPKGQTNISNICEGINEGNDYSLLMIEIKQKISKELKSPWVPQFCCGLGNRKGSSSLNVDFRPQLNLHIPQSDSQETFYQVPNIFQQTSAGEFDLVSSVLHKSAIDLFSTPQKLDGIRLNPINRSNAMVNSPLKQEDNENVGEIDDPVLDKQERIASLSPLQKLIHDVEALQVQNELCIKERMTSNNELTQIQLARSDIEASMEIMKKDVKMLERTCVILENPNENIVKLEGLIDKTRERRLAVENQWKIHREPALKQIDELEKLRQTKNLHNIQELRKNIREYEVNLRDKTNIHAQLAEELKRNTVGVAPRKEYTIRIYEFIGNIRKQRNDIYKILDDTRDLQKQINSISAQLQRQFNYTDDLFFQSAKIHIHAKQAYKLLASLHLSCNQICDLVSRTGQMNKEARDLEVQIDRERLNNVGASLDQITRDIKQCEAMITSLQGETQKNNNVIL